MLGKEILRAEKIEKSFNGNKVLDQISFSLHQGNVHALCGENGAGKSTVLKIITGIYTKDAGNIYLNDEKIEIDNVTTARKYGIYVVPQEMQMVPELSIAENIFLGNYPMKHGMVDWKTMFEKAEEIKKKLGRHTEKMNVHTKVSELGMGEWQMIEIMRALIDGDNMKVLAFDEPTASLSDSEAEVLFGLIREFKEKGVAIVYVSHRMKEIFKICDQISVFRDGKCFGTKLLSETNQEELVAMMVGRNINLMGNKKDQSTIKEEVYLKVEDFTDKKTYQNCSFVLHKGEILGFYGLIGAGRTELMRGIFGLDKPERGNIWVKGKKVKISNPKTATKMKMGFVTEDRREEGLMLDASLKWNISMPNLKGVSNRFGLLSQKMENEYADKGMKIFRVKAANSEVEAGTLSGGNQQKIVLAKWVNAECEILIIDEPTRGIDVGAKAEVYDALKELARQGKAIIVVSSELPEILGISDRIVVMCEGKITANMVNDNLTEEDVVKYAFE